MNRPRRNGCPLCGTPIRRDDTTRRNKRGQQVHTDCDSREPFDVRSISNTGRDHDNQPAFTVAGQRNHEQRCTGCHLVHAGECF